MVCWWFVGELLVVCWWFVSGLLMVCWWFVGGLLVFFVVVGHNCIGDCMVASGGVWFGD